MQHLTAPVGPETIRALFPLNASLCEINKSRKYNYRPIWFGFRHIHRQ